MKIAVYAICKNEGAHVQGWLENVRDADHVVLCDTGSTDNGLYDARGINLIKHQIHVIPFRFDVARTTALSLVPPDVDLCVSLDLDERLDPGWRQALERCWNAIPRQRPTRIWAQYHTEGLQPFLHDSRIHARHGYRWDHPCHECIVPYGIQEVQVASDSLVIRHYPDKTKPRGQYLDLLAVGIDEGHKAASAGLRRRIFYYSRELIIYRHFKTAIGWLQKYVQLWEQSGEEEWGEVQQAKAMLTLAQGALMEVEAAGAQAAPSIPSGGEVEQSDYRDSLARQSCADAARKVALGEEPATAFVDADSLAKGQ